MEKKDILLIVAGLMSGVLLLMFTRTKEFRRRPKLRVVFALPMLIAIIHIEKTDFEPALIGTYLGCAGLAFIAVSGKRRALTAGLCGAAILSSAVICPLDRNYRTPGYERDFEKCFTKMKKSYVLTEYKGIDWDALHERFQPMFREADLTRDVGLCYEAGRQFAMAFRDGHVNFTYGSDDEEIEELGTQYDRSHCGEDYGFALLRNSDGRVVFVNVDSGSAAYAAGIRDGLEITAIDGEPIEDVISGAYVWFDNFPDRENEAFYAPLAATSAKSGEITVSFRDSSETEKTVPLSGNGSFYGRFKETLRLLDCRSTEEVHNMRCCMVDGNTGCLVLNGMEMDDHIMVSSEVLDWIREKYPDEDGEPEWLNDRHGQMKMQLWYEIEQLKEQGAENLIIDMRNNHGGLMTISGTIASLLTDDELFLANEGEPEGHGYRIAATKTVQPDNKWGSGNIVVLVNKNSASAAEIFARCVQQMDNVTVMGLTKSCGCAQATTGNFSGKMAISGSIILTLDEEGEILIDSGTDRLNRYAPDVMIPLDDDAINAIFVERSDYVLDIANKYLDSLES